MNLIFHKRTSSRAFTLIELLTVIAIIGILAGLIISGAGVAAVKARQHRVEAERDALITAIQSYKEHKGFYPPDNSTNGLINTMTNSLFYELTGVQVTNNNGTYIAVNQDTFTPGQFAGLFTVGGVLNSTGEQGEVAKNYYSGSGKSARTVSLNNGTVNFTLFALPVPGPAYSTVNANMNFWNYVSSTPTNNPGSFDLWMDVTWGGKTNRISNWSKNPQVL